MSEYDLDADDKPETVYFKIRGTEYGDWSTDIFVNNSRNPLAGADDLIVRSSTQDISKKTRIMKLEMTAGGNLVNTLLYQYRNGELIEIPIITNPHILGTWNNGGTQFKDSDEDGVSEMFVYHGFYPVNEKRTVEIYKFDGNKFIKNKEYKETTANVYY